MLALAAGGVVLSGAFRNAAQASFDSGLEADMDGLIAAADPDPDGGVQLQDRFLNSRFARIYSGLYYQIKPGGPGTNGGQISRSLFDKQIKYARRSGAQGPRRAGARPRVRKISICGFWRSR